MNNFIMIHCFKMDQEEISPETDMEKLASYIKYLNTLPDQPGRRIEITLKTLPTSNFADNLIADLQRQAKRAGPGSDACPGDNTFINTFCMTQMFSRIENDINLSEDQMKSIINVLTPEQQEVLSNKLKSRVSWINMKR